MQGIVCTVKVGLWSEKKNTEGEEQEQQQVQHATCQANDVKLLHLDRETHCDKHRHT